MNGIKAKTTASAYNPVLSITFSVKIRTAPFFCFELEAYRPKHKKIAIEHKFVISFIYNVTGCHANHCTDVVLLYIEASLMIRKGL